MTLQRLSVAELIATIGSDMQKDDRTPTEEAMRILRSFEHFVPTKEQVERIARIRAVMAGAAHIVLDNVRPGPELDRVIEMLHTASQKAIGAIVLELNYIKHTLAKVKPVGTRLQGDEEPTDTE